MSSEFQKIDNNAGITHRGTIPRAIIHIGAHKTGTSFLQQIFHVCSSDLLAKGVYYPQLDDTPYITQHSSLAIALRAHEKAPALNALARIREDAEKLGAHTILLSGEDFFFATQDEVACVARGLRESTIGEFQIILYMRNTYDYIRSQLNQHLRYEDYAITQTLFVGRLAVYEPDEIVRRWESVFGSEAVHVFSYDQQKGRLLDHFIEAAGLPPLRPCLVPKSAINASIDFLCAQMINQLLFDKPASFKAAVYLELISNQDVPGDFLYPAEAALIENIIAHAGIEIRHPKLLQIQKYLTNVPDARAILVDVKKSVERVMTTLKVIDSMLASVFCLATLPQFFHY
jgi:hypothetical protein